MAKGSSRLKVSPKLLGVQDAGLVTGLSVSMIRNLCSKGRLVSHKIGSRRLVAVEELDRLIKESELPRVDDSLRAARPGDAGSPQYGLGEA